MLLFEIKKISKLKKGVYKRIYIDEEGIRYIGNKDGTIERAFGNNNLTGQVLELVDNKIYIGTEPPQDPHEGKLWIQIIE